MLNKQPTDKNGIVLRVGDHVLSIPKKGHEAQGGLILKILTKKKVLIRVERNSEENDTSVFYEKIVEGSLMENVLLRFKSKATGIRIPTKNDIESGPSAYFGNLKNKSPFILEQIKTLNADYEKNLYELQLHMLERIDELWSIQQKMYIHSGSLEEGDIVYWNDFGFCLPECFCMITNGTSGFPSYRRLNDRLKPVGKEKGRLDGDWGIDFHLTKEEFLEIRAQHQIRNPVQLWNYLNACGEKFRWVK